MTLTGSGVGGNVGGPQVPLQRDLEATAWTEINKANLGITSDTLEKAFTQMNPRYTSGYYGGYKSSEGQPLLDHALETGRIAQGFNALPDESWKPEYDEFVKQLPKDVLEEFLSDGRRTFDERRGSFTALDNVLILAAKITTRAAQLAQMEAAGSLDTERAILNQVLPFTALRGAIGQGANVAEFAQAYVNTLGPNHPLFDTYNNFLTQMGSSLIHLQEVMGELRKGGISQAIVDGAARIAANLQATSDALARTNLGDNLQILRSTLQAMTLSATSLSLFPGGSGSLFLGLSLSSIGLKTGESETGIVGDSITKIISSGLVPGLIPGASLGSQKLLEMSLTTGFTCLIGLAALAIEPGYGVYPNKDPLYAKSSQFFGFELMLLLMNSSGALKQTLTPFLQAAGVNEKSADAASDILSQLGSLLMILASTRDGRQNPAYLIESNSRYLEKGVAAASNLIDAETDSSNALSIALQQSQMTLDDKNYEGFIEANANLLEAFGISLDQLKKDIEIINKQARTIFESANTDDAETTAVVRFV